MARSFSAIVQSMKAYIFNKNSSLDLSEGTITNDIIISAPAQELESLYVQDENTSMAQSIETASDLAMDVIAANAGLVRKSARKAVGGVTFFSYSTPVSDITIPAGTTVSTVPSSTAAGIQYTTTRTVTMYSKLGASYLNPLTGYFEIQVEIEAVTGGTDGNVGGGTIVSIIGVLAGVNGCYNTYSVLGGIDTETTASLKVRIAERWSGPILGTESGILTTILAQGGVQDASVVAHGDTGRDDFGAVDVFIKGMTYRNQNDLFTTSTATFSNLMLSKQPVILNGISLVQASATGLFSTTAYQLTKDVGLYGGSVLAQDMVQWVSAPGSGSGTIYVTYNYNGLVEDLQNIFNKTNKDILNTNLLIKQATEVPIDVTCNMKILAGFDAVSTQALVQTQLAQFFNDVTIGEQIQQSDVVGIIVNTPGVDDVQLPLTRFQSSSTSAVAVYQNSFGDLDIPAKGYATAGTFVLTVVT